jgi:hypothetical protein
LRVKSCNETTNGDPVADGDRRSISFPSMRKARLISFRALICPIKTTGSEITRRSTVTARTDLIWGVGGPGCSQAMSPAETKPITAKSLRRMSLPLPHPYR